MSNQNPTPARKLGNINLSRNANSSRIIDSHPDCSRGFGELALLLDPRLHVQQARMHGLQLVRISTVSIGPEPSDHCTHLTNHRRQHTSQDAVCRDDWSTSGLAESFSQALDGQVIASQTDGLLVVFFRVGKCLGGEDTDIFCGDPLEGFLAEVVGKGGHEDFGREAGLQVLMIV